MPPVAGWSRYKTPPSGRRAGLFRIPERVSSVARRIGNETTDKVLQEEACISSFPAFHQCLLRRGLLNGLGPGARTRGQQSQCVRRVIGHRPRWGRLNFIIRPPSQLALWREMACRADKAPSSWSRSPRHSLQHRQCPLPR